MRRILWILTGFLALGLLAKPAFAPIQNVSAVGRGLNISADLPTSHQKLPPLALSSISAAIGRDQAAYHAVAVNEGFRLNNRQSGLSADFTRQGVRIGSGTRASWALALEAYGENNNLQPVAPAKPHAISNRVEYGRGTLSEWYVNGPAGLEQGFTIAKVQGEGDGSILTLALGITGNFTPTVDATKTRLTLSDGRGQARFQYTGLAALDARGQELHAWLELNGKELLLRVEAAGAHYPVVVDPWIQVAKLTASDGVADDTLASALSISTDGLTVVAGAPRATIAAHSYQGAVYVFIRPSAGWTNMTQAAKLTASDGNSDDELGYSVSVSADGSTIVAGAPQATVGSNTYEGAAYIFVRPSTGWHDMTQLAKLTASDGNDFDLFAHSVSTSGDGSTVAVGSIEGSPLPPRGPGAVYVFVRPSSGWADLTQAAKLTASDGQQDDQLGYSANISADGLSVVAGAPYASANGTLFAGKAYVFTRSSQGWTDATETVQLTASDGASYDELGTSVSLSADSSVVVAGAPLTHFGGNYSVGEVYVFVAPPRGWKSSSGSENEVARLTASDGQTFDQLGQTVSVSADGATLLAGAPGAYAAYVFTEPSGGWAATSSPRQENAKLVATDAQLYGPVSLSADGLTVSAGAPGATVNSNSFQGAAYIFSNAVSFSSFDVQGLDVSGGPHSTFDMNAKFILDGGSNGIDPVSESVTVVIGSQVLAFRAGSFHQNGAGNYVFSGVVEGVRVDVQIKVLGSNAYQLLISGHRAILAGTSNPVRVILSIGDDTGTAQVIANIH